MVRRVAPAVLLALVCLVTCCSSVLALMPAPPENVRCGVCGKTNEVYGIRSYTSFGYPDLDFREANMGRNVFMSSVQDCSRCKYASGDLTKASKTAKETVKTAEYKAISYTTKTPEDAKVFLRASHIYTKERKWSEAAFAALYSAWCCDDAGRVDGAVSCRRAAIARFEALEKAAPRNFAQKNRPLIVVDLYRRTSHFDKAIASSRKALSHRELGKNERKVLKYQIALSRRRDVKCHSMSECLEK